MRWVKSTEELPKLNDWGVSENVLLMNKNGDAYIGYLYKSDIDGGIRWKFIGTFGTKGIEEVPYWAPIPPIPEN